MERELVHERTMAGLSAARARGRFGGCKPNMDASKLDAAKKLLRAGTPVSEVAKTLGVGRATLYRNLNADKQPERVELPKVTEDFLPTRASQHQPSRESL
jgi:DNA invertase Pin-like site-specific DNA recombinase